MMIGNEPDANEEEAVSNEAVEETGVVDTPAVHVAGHNTNVSMMPSSANIGHNLIERDE